jgi:NADH pyrophosphatase NudC (nudix superfamily)
MKCPGVDPRFLKAETRDCPHCGYEVEIFSDEVKVRCPKCKKYVYRKNLPSCLDWCRYGSECRGLPQSQMEKKKKEE